MKFSMYMASANRLGIPHEMMTVINLGRRSSAPLQKNKYVTYNIAFFTVFNLQSHVRRDNEMWLSHRVWNQCVQLAFLIWLSKVNVLKAQNYNISFYTGFFTGIQNILPPSHDIPAFSGTKLITIPLSAELIKTAGTHKYQVKTIVSAWKIIIHSKTLLIQNQVIWNTT